MNLGRAVMVAVISLGLSAGAASQTILDGDYPDGAPFDFLEMHGAVSSSYDDPRSAQYKFLSVVQTAAGAVICGLAYFKNASGGYDAFEPFVVEPKDGKAKATIPHRHRAIQTDIVAHSPCWPVLGVKPLLP